MTMAVNRVMMTMMMMLMMSMKMVMRRSMMRRRKRRMMMAVSRNLAINLVCSKLEPFIRGHDLPKFRIVNDDDSGVGDALNADDAADDDAEADAEPFTGRLNCAVLHCSVHKNTPMHIGQDGKIARQRIHLNKK